MFVSLFCYVPVLPSIIFSLKEKREAQCKSHYCNLKTVFLGFFFPVSCLSAMALLSSIINGRREKCWNWNQSTFLLVINLVAEEIEFRNKCRFWVTGTFNIFFFSKTVQIRIQKYLKRAQHETPFLLNYFGHYSGSGQFVHSMDSRVNCQPGGLGIREEGPTGCLPKWCPSI